MTDIQPGIYKHYKGGLYEVFGNGLHTETKQPGVTYRPKGAGTTDFCFRPIDVFLETVIHEGKEVKRFTLVEKL